MLISFFHLPIAYYILSLDNGKKIFEIVKKYGKLDLDKASKCFICRKLNWKEMLPHNIYYFKCDKILKKGL